MSKLIKVKMCILWFLALTVLVSSEGISTSNNTIPAHIESKQNKILPSFKPSLNTKVNDKTKAEPHSVESEKNVKDLESHPASLPQSMTEAKIPDVDGSSLGTFKYYFILLFVSSLSVICVIIYKTLRLRKTRAELKYGASNTDRSEVEPLGKSNSWLEESSDENEDELFDINFLKNSRSQNGV